MEGEMKSYYELLLKEGIKVIKYGIGYVSFRTSCRLNHSGFSLYKQRQWNKLMHSINGNTKPFMEVFDFEGTTQRWITTAFESHNAVADMYTGFDNTLYAQEVTEKLRSTVQAGLHMIPRTISPIGHDDSQLSVGQFEVFLSKGMYSPIVDTGGLFTEGIGLLSAGLTSSVTSGLRPTLTELSGQVAATAITLVGNAVSASQDTSTCDIVLRHLLRAASFCPYSSGAPIIAVDLTVEPTHSVPTIFNGNYFPLSGHPVASGTFVDSDITARVCTLWEYYAILSGSRVADTGWESLYWGVNHLSGVAVVPIQNGDMANGVGNAQWTLGFMEYPFVAPVFEVDVISTTGVNTAGAEATAVSHNVHVPGPYKKVLFVFVDIQRSNAGIDNASMTVGVLPGTVTVLDRATNNVTGGVSANVGFALRDATTVIQPLNNNAPMLGLNRYFRYFNGSDDYKSAFVVAADTWAVFQANVRSDTVNTVCAYEVGGNFAPTYSAYDDTAITSAMVATWTTALTCQPVDLSAAIGGSYACSFHQPHIMVALASGFCRYSHQLTEMETVDNIGKLWSMLNSMNLGLATMVDELSRTQGWPEGFLFGWMSVKGDEVVNDRLIPEVNQRLDEVINRRQVGLAKRERYGLTYPTILTGCEFMTLSRVHPYWSHWFFGYDYIPEDNSIDASREPRAVNRIDDNTVAYRLTALDNFTWSASTAKRVLISKLLGMSNLVPNKISSPLKLLSESGDIDVDVYNTYMSPVSSLLFVRAQAAFQVIPDPSMGVFVTLQVCAPPVCYTIDNLRQLFPALDQTKRYYLENKQEVPAIVASPSLDKRLYSDVFIPGGSELPFLGEVPIAWDGMVRTSGEPQANTGGDDYTE